MGKTSKPLRILITDKDLYERADVQALVAQGHLVFGPEQLPDNPHLDEADLYIGRRCWYMDQLHMDKHLDSALKAARKRAYPKEAPEDG